MTWPCSLLLMRSSSIRFHGQPAGARANESRTTSTAPTHAVCFTSLPFYDRRPGPATGEVPSRVKGTAQSVPVVSFGRRWQGAEGYLYRSAAIVAAIDRP